MIYPVLLKCGSSSILRRACRKLHMTGIWRVTDPLMGSPALLTHQHTPTCSKHCTGSQSPDAGSQRGMNVFFLYFSAVFWFFSRKRSHWLSTANTAQVHVNLVESEKFRQMSWQRHLVHRADNPTTFICWLSWNLGASTSRNPQRLSRPVQGLLPFYSAVRKYRTAIKYFM